jgi:two-component system chemotaxis response regulator CheY
MKALVVDDSRAIRGIVGGYLKELGFDTLEASNGREALERLKDRGPVELAMVDWNMPEMNGYEFVCAVRKDNTHAEMKIVMVTTETEMAQMVKALTAGAQEYIMKPFTKEIVSDKLTLLGLTPSRPA